MKVNAPAFIFLAFVFPYAARSLKFEDITTEIFPVGDDAGLIAAFGHFNTDEFTDVISLQQNGNKLQLLKGSENRPYFQPSLNCSFRNIIIGVIPGDYNGDSVLDLLVILSKDRERNELQILWGTNGTIDCKSENIIPITIINHPLVVDFNGDMIPDIVAEDEHHKRHVWISSKEKSFSPVLLPHVEQNLSSPHSSGLIDLNNDLTPDLLMTGEFDIETWIYTGKEFVLNNATNIPYPSKVINKGQSTFVDLNLDGNVDHVIPVCYDRKCEKSAVLVWDANSSRWETLLDDFWHPTDKTIWGFKLPFGSILEMAALPITLRAGDVDMDGYPDFITVLQSKKSHSNTQGVILRNVPCDDCYSGRKIQIDWDVPGLKDIHNSQIASFFDIFEDGSLDILISTRTSNDWKIRALRNTEIFDSCFLKVLVLSGLCHHNCTTEPYGVNQPGPMVRYNMTTQNGQPLVSTSIQLSQSAHFPLQLPYSLFGLGQTPNFIDVLTVSIPASFNQSVHKREWIQIIPNSQIVIIPHPPSDEKKWVKKLFVTPSHLVLLTCIALIGTCIFISLLVALLHWKERREDKKEKMQDAYRFPFDAM